MLFYFLWQLCIKVRPLCYFTTRCQCTTVCNSSSRQLYKLAIQQSYAAGNKGWDTRLRVASCIIHNDIVDAFINHVFLKRKTLKYLPLHIHTHTFFLFRSLWLRFVTWYITACCCYRHNWVIGWNSSKMIFFGSIKRMRLFYTCLRQVHSQLHFLRYIPKHSAKWRPVFPILYVFVHCTMYMWLELWKIVYAFTKVCICK